MVILSSHAKHMIVEVARHHRGFHKFILQALLNLCIKKCVPSFRKHCVMPIPSPECLLKAMDELVDFLMLFLGRMAEVLGSQRLAAWVKPCS